MTAVQSHSALLAANPASPYRFYRSRIGAARYDEWAESEGSRAISQATGSIEDEACAIAWRHLAWDSEMFGFSAARIELFVANGDAEPLLAETVRECGNRGVRHLIARVDASSLGLAQSFSATGFELIDGIQTFSRGLDAGMCELPPGTRLATDADAEAVADIARDSFCYDRFHNDRALTEDIADRVNAAWARNSVLGRAADAVLIASAPNGSIAAFVTVKMDTTSYEGLGIRFASIPLVATAAEHRGKGAARLATEAALAWCQQRDVDIVEVGTQIANIPAARLYQSAGFRTAAISLTYRRIIRPASSRKDT